MNAERLLQLYDRVSDAPDAILRLRRFILDLAIRGKLVEQDPEDESATELLERICRAKALRVRTGQIKSRPDLPDVLNEGRYDLPSSWIWVRFSNLADFSAGRTPSRNDPSLWNSGDYAWVSIADMVNGERVVATKETVSNKARSHVFKCEPEPPGTVIMSFKLTIGKISRLQVPAFHNEAIISIRPHLDELDPFLFRALPDLARGGETKGAIKGATLNRESISNILVPLPPVPEQHRIVAKVDELMVLCDSLEAERGQREATRDRLTTASLSRLTAPDVDEKQFKAHADFAIKVLPELTTRPDQIKVLRQTILDLAVRGKLVEQDPNDEPAEKLLAKIREEKVIKSKNGHKSNNKSAIKSKGRSAPMRLPMNWADCEIGDVLTELQTGPFGSSLHQSDYETGGIPVINPASIQDERIVPLEKMAVGRGTFERLKAFRLQKDDIVMARRGEMGRCAVVNSNEAGWLCGTGSLVLRPSRHVYGRFLVLLLGSPFGRHYLGGSAVGSTMQNLNQGILLSLKFGLPPFAEQHRIVARVDELMRLSDRLERDLISRQNTRTGLLKALLVKALEPMNMEAHA